MQIYTIKLPEFEGPFDLLLFFIERDELDIHNIPIAKITGDFLSYLRQMEAIDIEVAAEFIYVASSLLRIKARMMLPVFSKDAADPDNDPRRELVQQLLEYKRYRDTLHEFRQREEMGMKLHKRGNIIRELEEVSKSILGESELENLTLYKLLHTFEKVMERFSRKDSPPGHPILNYPYSMEEIKFSITEVLKRHGKLHAQKIFKHCHDRLHAIFTFLALLELIQAGTVLLLNGEGVNNFYISTEPAPSLNLN